MEKIQHLGKEINYHKDSLGKEINYHRITGSLLTIPNCLCFSSINCTSMESNVTNINEMWNSTTVRYDAELGFGRSPNGLLRHWRPRRFRWLSTFDQLWLKSSKLFQLDSILIFLATENRQIIDDMNTINLQESEGWRYPKYNICEIVDSDSAFRKILPVSTPNTEFAAPGFVGNSMAELLIRWLQSPNSNQISIVESWEVGPKSSCTSKWINDDQWIYRFFVVQS